jgi:hypothetical protein
VFAGITFIAVVIGVIWWACKQKTVKGRVVHPTANPPPYYSTVVYAGM